MATIKKYQLKNGKTRYSFEAYLGKDYVTGESVVARKRGFTSQREAERQLVAMRRDFKEGVLTRESKWDNLQTFDDLFNAWFKEYKETVKESTASQMLYRYNHYFKKRLGKAYFRRIDRQYMQAFVEKTSKKVDSYKKVIGPITLPFAYAKRLGIIDYNPMDDVIYPRDEADFSPQEEKGNFYSGQELQVFLQHAKDMIGTNDFSKDLTNEQRNCLMRYVFFRTLAYSGVRKGEALGLTWRDIDFKNDKIIIRRALTTDVITKERYTQAPKTKNSARDLYMDAETMKILRQWYQVQKAWLKTQFGSTREDKDQFVFTNSKNKPYASTSAGTWLKRIYDLYPDQKRITLHGFRHTHASLLFEAGATIKEVQTRLGHASADLTVNIYTHVMDDRRKRTGERFANYLNEQKDNEHNEQKDSLESPLSTGN